MLESLDQPTAILLTKRIAAVGAFLASAEILAVHAEYRDGGLFSWQVMQVEYVPRPGRLLSRVLNAIMGSRAFTTITVSRTLAAATLVIVPNDETISLVCITILVASTLQFHLRCPYGLDGADQMLLLILVALLVQSLFPADRDIAAVILTFIALQACLSYFVAGVSKLTSPLWRSGEALSQVLNTESYGSRLASNMLFRLPWGGRALNWSVVGFECAFPLVLVVGMPTALVFVVWGVLFHLGSASLMGLNTFLWAFGASYPSVLYLSSLIH
jgi:hypothetical protein